MKTKTWFLLICLLFSHYSFSQDKIRSMVDSVGFTSKAAQMDEFMKYMSGQGKQSIDEALKEAGADETTVWKSAICPHDDYTYVGYLYPALLQNVKAKTIFLIGVCHKAKLFKLENKIIFDSFE
ncbi:MAG: MEMO1 family protein [Bacteroidetes bacterium]|nr:MEMO1 family protein [Bacteroidota bacterium]